MLRFVWKNWQLLPLMLILGFLLGCGGDGVEDSSGSIATIPNAGSVSVITIEKLGSKEGPIREDDRGNDVLGEEITWRLNANPAPRTDLVVIVRVPDSSYSSREYRILIPTHSNRSTEFTSTSHSHSIEILPLPTVSIVGKGVVVDLEELQGGLPANTLGGHRIPKDFPFPLYTVGQPKEISCEICRVIEDIDLGPPSATAVQLDPPSGMTIPPNVQFALKFDAGVNAATVNGSHATGSGTSWRVLLELQPGPNQSLTVEWTNRDDSTGSAVVGPYTVLQIDEEPPEIVAGTVRDGAVEVDPVQINADGFRFDFDEAVAGTVKLTDEVGADLHWIGQVQAQTATLIAVAGQELTHETLYKIEIDVRDGAGNQTQRTIEFATKPKE